MSGIYTQNGLFQLGVTSAHFNLMCMKLVQDQMEIKISGLRKKNRDLGK